MLGRATVMGQHGTDGAGGSIERVKMPDDLSFQFTKSRSTFAGSDEFNLEAKGVTLDIRLPVTLESELAKINGEDQVMDAAVAQLDEMIGANAAEGSGEESAQQPVDRAEDLLGSWMWGIFLDPVNGPAEISNPENYILTFNEDGTVNVKADCNNAQGAYTLEDGSLSIELGPMTAAACEEGSRSDDFVKYLGFAATPSFQEGYFAIDLTADGGTMAFTPAEDGS